MLKQIDCARNLLQTYAKITGGESVLVIAEREWRPMKLGEILTAALESLGSPTSFVTIPDRTPSRTEPPPMVAAAMKQANVVFALTEKVPMVHTNARKEATAAGVRFFTLHEFTRDDLERVITAEDFRAIKERTEKVAQLVTQAKTARVTSAGGTDITLGLEGREAMAYHPMGEGLGSSPIHAEAAIAPVEGTAEGVVVSNLSISQWKYLFREPLRYTVRAGRIKDISGDKVDVERLRKQIATDENASNVAELGIGTSHLITGPMTGAKRDSGRIGTVHIGIGRNNDFGGNTWSAIHFDTVMDQVEVALDGRCVLKNGKLEI